MAEITSWPSPRRVGEGVELPPSPLPPTHLIPASLHLRPDPPRPPQATNFLMTANAWDPKYVTQALQHSCSAKRPRSQYLVGQDAKFVLVLIRQVSQRGYETNRGDTDMPRHPFPDFGLTHLKSSCRAGSTSGWRGPHSIFIRCRDRPWQGRTCPKCERNSSLACIGIRARREQSHEFAKAGRVHRWSPWSVATRQRHSTPGRGAFKPVIKFQSAAMLPAQTKGGLRTPPQPPPPCTCIAEQAPLKYSYCSHPFSLAPLNMSTIAFRSSVSRSGCQTSNRRTTRSSGVRFHTSCS